nr:serine hydrolase domain-containing protein [Sphingomonas sp. CFBP 13733]
MLVKAVEERVGGKAAKDHFSGAVLISHLGRILFQMAYGLADKTNHKPNTLDTQFRFGSMGKMFTAVAIMQLVQDNKIDLDAPIGRYLTGYQSGTLPRRSLLLTSLHTRAEPVTSLGRNLIDEKVHCAI